MSGCGGVCGGGCLSCYAAGSGSSCNFAKVVTSCPSVCGPFELGDAGLCFYDTIIQTQLDASGVELEYFHQDIHNSRHDPLYDEPIQRVWRGPWVFKALVEWPQAEASSREEGFQVVWDGTVTMARATLEGLGAPMPEVGDVLHFWPNKFFAKFASGGAGDPKAGYYFDVVNVNDEGHIIDTAAFVGFKLRIKRRTEMAPERRLAEG